MVLRTVLETNNNESIEILDLAARLKIHGRNFRGFMILRQVRPIQGEPMVIIRSRPTFAYNTMAPDLMAGSNHIRYAGPTQTLRLTTDIAPSYIINET